MPGIPLVAGAGDQVAGFVGAGLVDVGRFIDVAGTFPVFGTCVDSFVVDQEYGIYQSVAGPLSDDHWYLMTYIGGGGLTHRWFTEQFAVDLKTAAGEGDSSLFALLDAEAAQIEVGADGLIFVPHLAGRACPAQPDVRGTWIGFTWTHQRAHFYRAILESIAYDYAQALVSLEHYLPSIQRHDVRVIGGGAQSMVWNQIKADVLGLTYRRLHAADRASMGCAIMAGHAIGLYPDMASTARQFAQTIELIEPDLERHNSYQPYVNAYGHLLEQLQEPYTTLADLRNMPTTKP
jgi:xylulokinase